MERPSTTGDGETELLHIMRQWKKMEMKAIKKANDIERRSNSTLVKMIAGLFIHSSERHRIVLEMIADMLAKASIHISPDEFNELWEGVNSHIAAEEEAVRLARSSFER